MALPTATNGKQYVVDGATWNQLVAIVQRADNLSVQGPLTLYRSGSGRVIGIAPQPGQLTPLRIVSSTQDGSNLRWNYKVIVQKADDSAWIGYSDLDTNQINARNGIEAPNGTTGTLGCGINVANIPSGFSLQAIYTGAIVFGKLVTSSGTKTYIFSATNQVDGTCEGDD